MSTTAIAATAVKTDLIYMPTFRSKQQEMIVLESYNFGNHMYPLLEIVKEHDRERPSHRQKSFNDIYSKSIDKIQANKVFIDLPIYLKEPRNLKSEVLQFNRKVLTNMSSRTDYMLALNSKIPHKIIPVIASYFSRFAISDSIAYQESKLRSKYESIAFRIPLTSFTNDWAEVMEVVTERDFIIIDMDITAPYLSPSLAPIFDILSKFDSCPKILLRSSLNDIQNVNLVHDAVVLDIDNSLLSNYKSIFNHHAFGDYVGIKKDDLTDGGSVSPGFIFYNPVKNNFYGFKGNEKKLAEFEITIVPAVLKCKAVDEMNLSRVPYLTSINKGWDCLNNISSGKESGKNQAKFKKISMEHYLHIISCLIDTGQLSPL